MRYTAYEAAAHHGLTSGIWQRFVNTRQAPKPDGESEGGAPYWHGATLRGWKGTFPSKHVIRAVPLAGDDLTRELEEYAARLERASGAVTAPDAGDEAAKGRGRMLLLISRSLREALQTRAPDQVVTTVTRYWRRSERDYRIDTESAWHQGAAAVIVPVLADIVVIAAGGGELLRHREIGHGLRARKSMRPPPRL